MNIKRKDQIREIKERDFIQSNASGLPNTRPQDEDRSREADTTRNQRSGEIENFLWKTDDN